MKITEAVLDPALIELYWGSHILGNCSEVQMMQTQGPVFYVILAACQLRCAVYAILRPCKPQVWHCVQCLRIYSFFSAADDLSQLQNSPACDRKVHPCYCQHLLLKGAHQLVTTSDAVFGEKFAECSAHVMLGIVTPTRGLGNVEQC